MEKRVLLSYIVSVREKIRHFLLRGILIGGSMGVLYALAGFSDSLPRAFGVGMIGGALAGLTLAIRKRKRKDRQ